MAAAPSPKKFDRSLVEGPLAPAVWRLAWPTMLQNLVAGLQGVVDHALVGNMLGYAANAGIGVAWQIFLVVIVFMASLFTGQAVLVARFAGAGDHDKVNRVVYQAFITAIGMFAVLAPIGYFSAPYLLTLVNAAPEVRAQALPFLRINFVFSIGMLLFFMLSAALRAAGDARTPLRLGITMTVLNLVLNLLLIPKFGTAGSAMGTAIAAAAVSGYALWLLFGGKLVIRFTRELCTEARLDGDPIAVQVRASYGVQGIAMNVAGVLLLRFIGGLEYSAAAQAAYTIGYTELFSMITWTSVGLMGAAATIAGQNLGAGKPDRAAPGRLRGGPHRPARRRDRRRHVRRHPQAAARHLRRRRRPRLGDRPPAAPLPRRVGVLHQRSVDLHRRAAGHRRHQEPALDHARLSGRGADRAVHCAAGTTAVAAGRHLAGDPARPLHPLRALVPALPPGQVAQHQGGVGAGATGAGVVAVSRWSAGAVVDHSTARAAAITAVPASTGVHGRSPDAMSIPNHAARSGRCASVPIKPVVHRVHHDAGDD